MTTGRINQVAYLLFFEKIIFSAFAHTMKMWQNYHK